eukprot:TRINITY_DN26472_c0_g2_i1.p1 TRINITY_DN26472_c0_g2~~TRINITY_DN26472_c0_g2_i1.p1  ORF type:complete len:282 (+),score=41.77 TRINITY_DN26472_c0_g2_i1:203-1048(+)
MKSDLHRVRFQPTCRPRERDDDPPCELHSSMFTLANIDDPLPVENYDVLVGATKPPVLAEPAKTPTGHMFVDVVKDEVVELDELDEKGDADLAEEKKLKSCGLSIKLTDCKHGLSHVEKLLEHGASVNASDDFGDTPLHYAVSVGSAAIVRLLISERADVQIAGAMSQTPLLVACAEDHTETLRCLLKANGSVDCYDDALRSPLHWSVLNGNAEAVTLLLDAGAIVDENAEHYATDANHQEILHMLRMSRRGGYLHRETSCFDVRRELQESFSIFGLARCM